MSARSKAAARAGRGQAEAQAYPLQSPIGGLNTKDALASMPETDAVIIDNLYCQPSWVEVRGGHTTLGTFTGNGQTVLPYSALAASGNRLFVAVNNAGVGSIYRADNAGGGSVGAAVVGGSGPTVQAITVADFDYAQYGTASATVLWLVNGADNPLLFDGSTWYSITAASSPYALTGGPSPLTSLSQVAVYKQRLWFLPSNSMTVYYLAQNTFAGALTALNLGANFKLGGSIAAMITISIDNTAGTNDFIAFISTAGECVMFQGYDPSNVSTWYESAHFRMGAPIGTGRACWQKMGMDAAIICQDGLILLSEAMLTDRSQNKLTLSDKVRLGINQAIALYGANAGWQMMLYPPGNKLILNVPTAGAGTASYQFVMNTLTGAWTTWGQMASPLNAFAWENYQNSLYYTGPGTIERADYGLADNGNAITWAVKQAYSYMDAKTALKTWTQVQPNFLSSGNLSVAITMSTDFDTTTPTGSIPLTQASGALWNVSYWNTPTYWGDAEQVVQPWLGVNGNGFAGAIYMQASTNGVTAKWQSTNIMYKPGGTFYGR